MSVRPCAAPPRLAVENVQSVSVMLKPFTTVPSGLLQSLLEMVRLGLTKIWICGVRVMDAVSLEGGVRQVNHQQSKQSRTSYA